MKTRSLDNYTVYKYIMIRNKNLKIKFIKVWLIIIVKNLLSLKHKFTVLSFDGLFKVIRL